MLGCIADVEAFGKSASFTRLKGFLGADAVSRARD
jgi:hypothetical protein